MRTQPSFWVTRGVISTLLLPLAWLYGLGTMLHRLVVSPKALPIPVISIGNVTTGGAGKTPTTIALVRLLKESGYVPHILSRGYGAKIVTPLRVDAAHHTAQEVGDEALLLAQCAPTWVCPNRYEAGIAAIAAGANVLVCDDALQHHALEKDLNILVIDGGYGLGNARLLPAGPLRESLRSAVQRSHATIMIGNDTQQLSPKISLPLFNATIRPQGDTAWLNGTRVIAFAGIARPQKFYDSLLGLDAVLTATFSFADHHTFTEEELTQLTSGDAIAVTTQKDWVRLSPQWQARIKYLPITLDFTAPHILKQWINDALTS
ncbi:MAG: tetraacyldisaccharide 4'-kinase [Rickettsiales bacterium]